MVSAWADYAIILEGFDLRTSQPQRTCVWMLLYAGTGSDVCCTEGFRTAAHIQLLLSLLYGHKERVLARRQTLIITLDNDKSPSTVDDALWPPLGVSSPSCRLARVTWDQRTYCIGLVLFLIITGPQDILCDCILLFFSFGVDVNHVPLFFSLVDNVLKCDR